MTEGYATADAVFRATGYNTVMAIDCGNLKAVVQSIRKAKPNERIIIVADNDKYGESGKNPGVDAAHDIVKSSSRVSIFIPRFTDETTQPTDANDLLVLEGINELTRQLEETISFVAMGIPRGFSYDNDTLSVLKEKDDKEYLTTVCSNFYPKAISRDKNNQNWSKVFELGDPDGHKHTVTIPMEFISKEPSAILAPLLSSGLNYNRQSSQDLIDFIQKAEPLQRARNVNQVGWYGDSYVFPDHSIGKSNEPVIYQSTGVLPSGYEVSGTLEEWQNNVSKPCIDNSRLILMLCAAFSGPLIELIPSLESGGFHIRCESSRGKSTALRVCKSVWGDPSQLVTWRATSNGLESIAFMHNDAVLVIDELGQMADDNAPEAAQTIYMISNGASKQRANRTGGSAQLKTWRLIFVSAGEVSLSTVMNQAGKMVKGGQEVRFIDIPADAGAGLGLFDTIHEYPGGSEFAQMLNINTKTYYGTAAREFITQLTADKSAMTRRVEELITQFESTLLVNNVDGQISRVIKRFALIAAAGQLATEMGITGWPEAQAFNGIKRCFESWFSERPGGSASHESDLAISTVRSRIQEWKEARFINSNDMMTRHNGPTWGYINQGDFLIYPKNFRDDICEGLDHRTVAAVLAEKGFLVPDSDGKAKAIVVRLSGQGGQRFYRIKSELLIEDAPAVPYIDPDALVVPSIKTDDDDLADTEVKAGVDNSFPYTV